jgi:hypothetical protein
MFGTQIELVRALQSMARGGSKPSEMLRTVIAQGNPETVRSRAIII